VELWATSSHPRSELVDDGQFRIENRPMRPSGQLRGWQYHVRQLRYALSLLLSALRYKADLVVVNSGTIHWFPLALFSLMGMKVVTNLHSVYWPVGYPPKSKIRKLVMLLDGWFFSRFADASMGVSPECERQVCILAGRPVPFFQHRAQFRESDFRALKAPDYGLRPFRVMFAGRIERNKGIFDLIDIAAKLWQRRPHQIMFDVCGGGSAFDELREEVKKRGLGDIVKLHGKLIRPELLRIYEQSHLVIIPTRSDFCEGMPMVSAEAVLAGRPVLSSRVSNALDVLDEAIIEARTEDIEDYVAKIEQLLDHRDSYEKCAAACSTVSRQFIDRSRGKTAALGKLLEALRPGWKAAPSAAERDGFDAEPSSTATSL
jgi:glycosyltransferase involved in cell wall biosynthesis